MLRLKRFLVDLQANFFIGDQNAGLGDVARGTEIIFRGLEIFLRIGGSGSHFAGLMAALHPLPLYINEMKCTFNTCHHVCI